MDSSNQAGWWRPLDISRGFVYMAYSAHRPGGWHTVWVAKRSLAGGGWSRSCLKRPGERRCAAYRDDIGHKQPTLVVDGRGFIHVFVGMHHSRWHYYRSRHARWIKTMRFRGDELPNRRGRFTYPIATRAPNGDVWMVVRQSHISPIRGRLYRWRVVTRRWYSMGSFAAEPGYSPYPDDILASPDGRVHLLWAWAGGKAGAVRHAASYTVYNPRTHSYANAAGEPVAAPATPASPVIYQPLEEGELWEHVMDGYGQRGAKLTLDPDTGQPVIAYRYQAPADGSLARLAEDAQVRLAEWNGSAWERQVIYAGKTTPALGISHHGGEPHVYYDDAPAVSGTIAVVQVGDVDHVYRAAPAERTLYFGQLSFG